MEEIGKTRKSSQSDITYECLQTGVVIMNLLFNRNKGLKLPDICGTRSIMARDE